MPKLVPCHSLFHPSWTPKSKKIDLTRDFRAVFGQQSGLHQFVLDLVIRGTRSGAWESFFFANLDIGIKPIVKAGRHGLSSVFQPCFLNILNTRAVGACARTHTHRSPPTRPQSEKIAWSLWGSYSHPTEFWSLKITWYFHKEHTLENYSNFN